MTYIMQTLQKYKLFKSSLFCSLFESPLLVRKVIIMQISSESTVSNVCIDVYPMHKLHSEDVTRILY